MEFSFSVVRIAAPWRNARTWFLIAAVASVLLVGAAFLPGMQGARLPGLQLPPCPFRVLTGIPCPLCGMTSGTAWLLRGDWSAAWRSNPLSYPFLAVVLAAGCYAVAFRLLAGRMVRAAFSPSSKRALWTAALVLALLSWVIRILVG